MLRLLAQETDPVFRVWTEAYYNESAANETFQAWLEQDGVTVTNPTQNDIDIYLGSNLETSLSDNSHLQGLFQQV